MQISMDFDSKKLQRGFVNIEKANQIAVMNTLNVQVSLTKRNAISNINSEFINRNNFTENSIKFRRTELKSISQMSASAGATERASYMQMQEEGGTNRPVKASKTVHIATNRVRGGRKSGLITKSKRINKLKVAGFGRKKRPSGRKAQIMRRAAVAHDTGKYLRLKSGFFEVTSMDENGFKSRMIYNTKHRTTNVRPTKWLEPATEKPIRDGQAIYNSQINKLLKKDVI